MACALSVSADGEPQLIKIKCCSYIVFVKYAVLVKLQSLGNWRLYKISYDSEETRRVK